MGVDDEGELEQPMRTVHARSARSSPAAPPRSLHMDGLEAHPTPDLEADAMPGCAPAGDPDG